MRPSPWRAPLPSFGPGPGWPQDFGSRAERPPRAPLRLWRDSGASFQAGGGGASPPPGAGSPRTSRRSLCRAPRRVSSVPGPTCPRGVAARQGDAPLAHSATCARSRAARPPAQDPAAAGSPRARPRARPAARAGEPRRAPMAAARDAEQPRRAKPGGDPPEGPRRVLVRRPEGPAEGAPAPARRRPPRQAPRRDAQRLALHYVAPYLRAYGLCLLDGFLGARAAEPVLREVLALHRGGRFQDGALAGPGPGAGSSQAVRGDQVLWVAGSEPGCRHIGHLLRRLDRLVLHADGALGRYSIRGRHKVSLAEGRPPRAGLRRPLAGPRARRRGRIPAPPQATGGALRSHCPAGREPRPPRGPSPRSCVRLAPPGAAHGVRVATPRDPRPPAGAAAGGTSWGSGSGRVSSSRTDCRGGGSGRGVPGMLGRGGDGGGGPAARPFLPSLVPIGGGAGRSRSAKPSPASPLVLGAATVGEGEAASREQPANSLPGLGVGSCRGALPRAT